MSIDIIRGSIKNPVATNPFIDSIKEYDLKVGLNGTLFLGYPLSANIENSLTLDALLVTENFGLIAFKFAFETEQDSLLDDQGEIYFLLVNNLTQYPKLRRGRDLAINPVVVTVIPEEIATLTYPKEYIFTTISSLSKIFDKLPKFDLGFYPVLLEALQKVSYIKPKKKRDNVISTHTKGFTIKEIEKEIANLDLWQRRAALEFFDGPQRIRGLAGTGKTIVLALKAAYLHCQNPDWEIAVTFYTRSLQQQYKDLITKFVYEFTRDEPNWNKIHIYHAWGTSSEIGIYSNIARSIGVIPMNFSNARNKYPNQPPFSGVCKEIVQDFADKILPIYDVVMIDEAQDMPATFFKLVYLGVNYPKRIIWAYDELQNLSSVTMPTIGEMFGIDSEGKPIIELKNLPDSPMQDIILPICYRNPPWALVLAHSLGFGIYRKKLVQHFDNPMLWKEIGYELKKGVLDYNQKVTLKRSTDSYPKYFLDLMTSEEVINVKKFASIEEQYSFVANEIRKNIDIDELDPDDILIIFPDALSSKSHYLKLKIYLDQQNIRSILAGVTSDLEVFKINGFVSCSSIFRAKGNEAPMVYIVNSDVCFSGVEMIKLRNTLFTSITRARAWVRIFGIGEDMDGLKDEIDKLIKNEYRLTFNIPSEDELQRMRTINRDRSDTDAKKIDQAKKGIRAFLELIKAGEIDPSQIPELSTLLKLFNELKNDKNEED